MKKPKINWTRCDCCGHQKKGCASCGKIRGHKLTCWHSPRYKHPKGPPVDLDKFTRGVMKMLDEPMGEWFKKETFFSKLAREKGTR